MRRAALFALTLAACGAGKPVREPDAPAPPDALVPRRGNPSPIPSDARQLVAVTAAGWDATRARLRRFERAEGGAWRPAGDAVEVVLGRGGLGWGRGLHGDGAPGAGGGAGPVKQEGDGKSPAGVYRLGAVHGLGAAPPAGTRAPYAQLGPGWRCVDDPDSSHYNRVFDAAGAAVDWKSAEEMVAIGAPYRLLVVVEHNAAPARPGAGSCIFLHVWSGRDAPTAGCTAMPEADLAGLVRWLDPGRAVLVALPEGERQARREAWGLPGF